ncbi:MAG: T9SS type A sorting domain-containing protein [Chitinophagaceae bacterium]
MNLTHLRSLFTGITLLLLSTSGLCQKRVCGTMQAIQEKMNNDPTYKADYEKKIKDLNAYLANNPLPKTFANGDTVVIPVVVHVVLPNPNIITDDNVDYFINRLNLDYSGFNPDSTNGSSFYGVRGHSLLRFALARRDINGNATTGIERKVGAGTIGLSDPQPIKTAASGLAPWDITQYYNLWVGVGSGGLLGIAPEIGPGTQSGTAIDGICCDYTVFANNPCFSQSAFNLARTAVHEIGHNMGLYHTFDNGCSGIDFSQLSSVGMALPASLLTPADDTPPISTSTSGCPTQGTANGCTPSVPAMFQNYMDYTDDACYSMFTKGQVARMQYVVENFRPGYLTTLGHLPPNGTPINEAAANSIVSPGGNEVIGCNSVNYPIPTCGTGVFTPKLRVTNFGIQNLNSITVSLNMNGVLVASQTFTTNLLGGRSAVFSLPNQTLTNGVNVLKFYTSNPNGVLDSINSNDTLTLTTNFSNLPPTPATLPLVEGFEDATFNPTSNGWTVVNGNSGTTTWTRATNAAKTGSACATMKMFGYTNTGDFDYLKSPSINFNNTIDTAYISFNYAYRLKSNANSSKRDTLSVEIATDCGATNWVSIWKKASTALATNATVIATNWTAAAADWTTTPVKISLQNYKNTPIYVAFKTRNGNGQNIYIDDIKIYTAPNPLPLKLTSFNVQQNSKNVICKWETSKEENIKDFTVERSFNGSSFEAIGTVNATGNSTTNSYYQFTDENAYLQNSKIIYYRLKSNDINGKFNYSNVVFIKIGEKQNIQLYPNPAKDLITVNIHNSSNSSTNNTIQIVDYLGRILMEQKLVLSNGSQSIDLDISKLKNGNYITVIKNEFETKTMKFIKL